MKSLREIWDTLSTLRANIYKSIIVNEQNKDKIKKIIPITIA